MPVYKRKKGRHYVHIDTLFVTLIKNLRWAQHTALTVGYKLERFFFHDR